MAIPNPEYYFIANGLEISFWDLSTNIPTSWSWNFGDSNTSTSQNPTHTYAAAGIYNVRLISTNADGSKDIIKIISVAVTPAALGLTIADMVAMQLPATLTLNPTVVPNYTKKWQLIFSQNMDDILPADYFNETAWPDLWNMLIAYCVVYDIFLKLFGEAVIGGMQLNSSNNSSADSSTSGSGGLKRLVTGPSEAEWFDTSQHLQNMFKADGDGNTPFSRIISQACMLAGNLRVRLPWCPKMKTVFVPIKTENVFDDCDPQWTE